MPPARITPLTQPNSSWRGRRTSRRDRVGALSPEIECRKQEWTTSLWVIDEKAYAVGKQKKLILLKEQGVGSIGGIQGDYEFIEFTRDALSLLVVRLLQVFDFPTIGLRE